MKWRGPQWFARTANAPNSDPSILGTHAKRLLDDPVLALAFERIENKLAETWRHTAVGDADGREAAYRLHWAVEQLKSELAAILGNAKVIEAEQKRKERERRAA